MERKNALYVNGQGPQYELNAEEFCIPVYPDNNHKLFVRLSSIPTADYKKLLNTVNFSKSRSINSDVQDIVGLTSENFNDVLDDHFLELSGVKDSKGNNLSVDKQKDFLKARRNVKDKITLALVGNIATPETAEQPASEVKDYIVFDDSGDTQDVETEVTLADFDARNQELVAIKYTLKIASEADRIAYQKSSKLHSKTENKKEYSWSTTNYDSLSRLFDKLVIRVEGAVIDGEPCEEGNRDKWLPKIPLPWKSYVLSDVFTAVERKNG